MPPPPSPQSLLIIVSGPAGSGKTTVCERLLEEFADSIGRVVTTTSRAPRPGEADGVDYHFIPPDEFEEKIRAGEFIEWARVHGRYYGSQRRHIVSRLLDGRDILLTIDVQGARTFRDEQRTNPALAGRVRSIFIRPRSLEQLRERLLQRGDSGEEIRRRLRTAEEELQHAGEFDHVIISGTRDEDYAALRRVYLGLPRPAATA